MINTSYIFDALINNLDKSKVDLLSLKVGQIIKGSVVQLFDGNQALVSIKGTTVLAKTEVPLAKGQQSMFLVTSADDDIKLKLLKDGGGGLTNNSTSNVVTKEVMKYLDLKNSTTNKQIVEGFIKENLPLDKTTVNTISNLVDEGHELKNLLSASKVLNDKKLPITSTNLQVVSQFFNEEGLADKLVKLNDSISKNPNINNLPDEVTKLLIKTEEQVGRLLSEIRVTTNANSTANQTVNPTLNQSANSVVNQAGHQAVNQAGHQTATSSAISNAKLIENPKMNSTVNPKVNLTMEPTEASEISPGKNINDDAKLLLNESSKSQILKTEHNLNSDQNINKNIKLNANVNTNVNANDNNIKINLNSEEKITSNSDINSNNKTNSNINNGTNSSNVVNSGNVANSNLIESKNILHKLNSFMEEMQLKPFENIQNESVSLKENLEQLYKNKELLPKEIGSNLERTVQHLAGQQLINQPDTSPFSQLVFQIPSMVPFSDKPVYMKFQAKKQEGSKSLDPKDVSLAFLFQLNNIGDLVIKVKINDNQMFLQFLNNKPTTKEILKQLEPSFVEFLHEQGYKTSGFTFLPLAETKQGTFTETTSTYKGVDIRL